MKKNYTINPGHPVSPGIFDRGIFRLPFLMVVMILLLAGTTWGQTTVFTDNFDRGAIVTPLSAGGTPTMTYSTTSTITPPGTSSTNLNSGTNYNVLLINSTVTPAAGRTYLTGPLSTFSSPYNTTLSSNTGPVTWTFNMKTNRTTALSGFDATNYGSAVALVATSSDLMTANGYAVVMVKGTTNNSFKLVRFTDGLDANANLTTIIGPSADLGAMTRWASLKVVYTPSTNAWELYFRDDVSTTDPTDPTTGTLTQVGTSTVNATYTSTVMSHFGFFWDHGGTSTPTSNTGRYDNFSVAVNPIVTPLLTVLPSSLTGFNYVLGSGPSASQSYALSGVNLTGYPGNIAVGCLTNFEVSMDNANFYPSVNVAYTSSSLPSTTIYVRLITGLPTGNYNAEIITNFGGGAPAQNVTCSGFVLGGPATYTWTGATDNSWIVSTNWSPERTSPALNDILQFNNGNTYTITNVPTQTIAQLLVSGGSKISLQSAAAAILTLAGTTGDDLAVSGVGTELNISGASTLSLLLNSGVNGLINSSMTLSGAAHTVKSTDANSLVFATGSVFKATTGFTGNAFGTTALNSVKFQAGSTYVQDAGSNPFGAGAPSSVVVFEAGSLYKFTAPAGGPSYSGRTYANFENDSPAIQANQGSNPMTCNNYTVTSGTVNWDFSGGIVVKGNISVAPIATLTFGNATKFTNLTLSGTSAQTISGSGTITFGANSWITVNNSAGIILDRDIAADSLVFQSGIISTGTNTLYVSAGINVTGAGAGKYVNGKLQMTIPSGTTSTNFAIGDATNYTPVAVDFTGVTVAGAFTASTITGLHPNYATSGINTSKCVNRYWTLTNNSITFGTCDATFTFVPGDILGGANTANFIVKKWDPSTWSPTTVSTLTATTTRITGIISFSDFMIGEEACLPPLVYSVTGGGAYCAGGTGMPVFLTNSEAGVEYQLYIGGSTPVGSPVVSVGGPVSFGDQTAAGSYSVTGTRIAGGCSMNMDGTVTISINPLLPVSVSIVASANPVSAGTPVTFTATPENGGAAPAYLWSVNANVITGATNSTYAYTPVNNDQVVCVMTSNGDCISGNPATSNTVTMIVNPAIPADLTIAGTVSTTICYNATNIITVGSEATPYLVAAPNGHATFIAGSSILYEPGTIVESGAYMIGSIYSGVWCGAKSATIIDAPEGIVQDENVVNNSFFMVFPNPTTGVFTLEFRNEVPAGEVNVEVYGMQGKKVLSTTMTGTKKKSLSLDGSPTGCYYVRVISDNMTGSMKIIKK